MAADRALVQAPHTQEPASGPGPVLRTRLGGFLKTLRANGFKIGLAETADALAILSSDTASREAALKPALRALLCGRRDDWQRFDELFSAYWRGRGLKTAKVAPSSTAPLRKSKTLRQMMDDRSAGEAGPVSETERRDGADEEADEEDGVKGRREGASRMDRLSQADLRTLADPQALEDAHALAGRLAGQLRARLTRREKRQRRGARVDLRRTVRRSLGRGGLPLDLMHKHPRPKPLRLVILLDASGSMSNYTGVFSRFVHGLLDHAREAEAFVFHTRLTHVSEAMRERDAARALDRMGLMAQGIGGGTKIGDSLAVFNRQHAARAIRGRACVIILSDGYDTGPPEHLAAEMARLRRRCRRIVWLNPMLGWPGYEPTAGGMAAALPYVDLFAPAHSLESLAALEPYLARL